MKKFFSIVCVLLLSAVLFAGCGVAGSNTLVDIKFTQQVFYVDEDCPTKLTYNIYPSTASNFGQARISTSTQTFGELIDGVFGLVGSVIDFHIGDVLEIVDVADFEAADVKAGAGF